MRIAVVGAGLSGLTAARRLVDGGHAVTVFDKSRGLGGRLATRRTDSGGIDHGAPWVEAEGEFDAFLAALAEEGAATRHGRGYVGQPGMSGLVRPLARGVELVGGVRITGLEPETGGLIADGARHGPYDRIILAIPAPQAHGLTGAPELEAVVMAPTVTLLATFAEAVDAPDVIEPQGGPLSLAVRNDAKPERAQQRAWVAHATREWSQANLERTKEEIATDLLRALAAAVGSDLPEAVHVAGHRWRFARTFQPLGKPFLSLAGGRVLAGGDWALGPDAADAWASGAAMAEAVVD